MVEGRSIGPSEEGARAIGTGPESPGALSAKTTSGAPQANVVQFIGVTLHFGQKLIFDRLDLAVRARERLVVMGPSGTGKSTLLKLLLATLRPDGGSVLVCGQDVTRLSRRQLNQLRTRIGMVYQSSALISSLSVRDNLALALEEFTDCSPAQIERIVDEKLDFVGLAETKGLKPAELSGGMKKRIAVARALVLEPELVLFDEPTAGLDPLSSATVTDLINHLGEKTPVTCIVVTHEFGTAFRVATRLAMLHQGKIVAEGTPEAFRRSEHPIVAQFLAAGAPEWPHREGESKSLLSEEA
jgi:phospholipid/cholesterol/gamma-HCH transport system ATP-binding protein